MRKWDRLVDAYIEDYRGRGTYKATVAHTASRLARWGRRRSERGCSAAARPRRL